MDIPTLAARTATLYNWRTAKRGRMLLREFAVIVIEVEYAA